MKRKVLTVCLTTWKRHEQVHEIIGQLTKQSCRPRIFVWNNDNYFFKDDRAHAVVNCTVNIRCKHIAASMQAAGTPYVAMMDDDLYFGDDDVLADALTFLDSLPNDTSLIGPYGVKIFEGGTYEDGNHVSIPKGHGQYAPDGSVLKEPHNVPVAVLKGRLILGTRAAAGLADCWYDHHQEDLPLCFNTAGLRRLHHWAAGCFFDHANERSRLPDFPIDDKGMCNDEVHMPMRNAACEQWLQTCPPDPRVKLKPEK